VTTGTHATQLSVPPFIRLRDNNTWDYNPDLSDLFAKAMSWRKQHDIQPSGTDKVNVHVLAIDMQKDFCFPNGTLYVAGQSGTGAMDDNMRAAEFIYRNLPVISHITTTFDTHFAFQIFFAPFWQDENGDPLQPFRTITTKDIREGKARPNPAMAQWMSSGNYPWLRRQVEYYCEELERAGKYVLYLWPPHCILGGGGHPLVGIFHEARMFHNFARVAQSSGEIKGTNPLTENYSVLRPEVLNRFDGKPLDQKNTRFYETLATADVVPILGQAGSHCVKFTIEDLLNELLTRPGGDKLVQKVYIVEDIMSSVVVRDPQGKVLDDFTPFTSEALDKFRSLGAHTVKSTDPITDWPGVPF